MIEAIAALAQLAVIIMVTVTLLRLGGFALVRSIKNYRPHGGRFTGQPRSGNR